MAHVLGLRRLQEYVQGSTSLTNTPACILGVCYGTEQESGDDGNVSEPALTEQDFESLMQDFKSRIWLTYRRDMPPLGTTQLTSDAGWGCTIRTGQMLLAEALSRCVLGRGFRSADLQQHPEAVASVVGHFQDTSEPHHPFSIHNICQTGEAHGVVIGQWLGPWMLCKALEAVVNQWYEQQLQRRRQQQQQQAGGKQQQQQGEEGQEREGSKEAGDMGLGTRLRVHVVCDPAGGAPCLMPDRLKALFEEAGGWVEVEASSAAGAEGDAATSEPDASSSAEEAPPPLLVLLPLTLGVGKTNPRYFPQLKAVLSYPQSVGIVGGRPGSSLYFLGYQGDSLIYLDPHHLQPVTQLPQDLPGFFCPTPRTTSLSSIDPSLAIGFICTTLGEVEDLCSRLSELEKGSQGAPLLTVGVEGAQHPTSPREFGVEAYEDSPVKGDGEGQGDEWEML